MDDRLAALKVPVERLRWNCDPDSLGVTGTEEAKTLEEKVVAQERAVSALKFGMSMPGNDYNIFVAGEARTGLSFITRSYLEEAAQNEPAPPDWCYVHNFKEPDKPLSISLPQGMAVELAKDMDNLLEHLKSAIPEAFESDEYRQRKEEAVKKFTARRNQLLKELEEKVTESGFVLNMSQQGMMILPSKDGKPMTEEDLSSMTEEEKAALREKSEELHEEMNSVAAKMRRLEAEMKESQKELEQRIALASVGHIIDELQEKYQEHRQVLSYLVGVKNDVVRNLKDFRPQEQAPSPFPMAQAQADFTRYEVNVLIDNSELKGAPVVYESNPTYINLFGAMERRASFGALFTDFTMIKPGSLHQANGGYLVIQARDLLKWGISWEAIKRALRERCIHIEDQGEMFGMISTKGMKPEPIPLQVKIILIGEPQIYQILYQYDDQFKKLFKVKAHLDDQVDRTDEELRKYVSFTARMVEQRGLRNVDKTGLARLLEYGVEVAGRQKKLTLKMALIRDILREADYWAGLEGADTIQCQHVDEAIRQKKFRSSLPEEKLREFLLEGYVNVDTEGEEVGQINGLSVYDLGDYSFGRPSRITTSISMGRQGVVNIDRESKLSGNFHTKGVLIMEGCLKARYALEQPLSLSASMVFEQSYSMVDGDSASAAEFISLVSSLADKPIKQGFAITGAISQKGEVQPIGGVNQKVEGFFEVCQAKGFTGEQGVIIPKANIPDLMLKGQVIEAAKEGQFTIHAVDHVDEAMELLMGVPAGERGEDGLYPEGTLNRLVEDKLKEMAEKAKNFGKDNGEAAKSDNNSGGCDTCGK